MAIISPECQAILDEIEGDQEAVADAYDAMVIAYDAMNVALDVYRNAIEAYNLLIAQSITQGFITSNSVIFDILNLTNLTSTSQNNISTSMILLSDIEAADELMEDKRVLFNTAATTYNNSIDDWEEAKATLATTEGSAILCVMDDIENETGVA